MSRSHVWVFAASACLVLGLSSAARANKVVDGADVSGPVQGVLVSAYANTSLASTALLYTVPNNTIGVFTLAQICINANGNTIVEGNTVGALMQRTDNETTDQCTTFAPGLALPPGEHLYCDAVSGGPSSCSVSVIQSAPRP